MKLGSEQAAKKLEVVFDHMADSVGQPDDAEWESETAELIGNLVSFGMDKAKEFGRVH